MWKGKLPTQVRIVAGHGRGDCSYGKLSGSGSWLFMGDRRGTSLHIQHRRGTRRSSNKHLARMIRQFGTPHRP